MTFLEYIQRRPTTIYSFIPHTQRYLHSHGEVGAANSLLVCQMNDNALVGDVCWVALDERGILVGESKKVR
jgi:hypothetical protein